VPTIEPLAWVGRVLKIRLCGQGVASAPVDRVWVLMLIRIVAFAVPLLMATAAEARRVVLVIGESCQLIW
jgi:hypothetical protein